MIVISWQKIGSQEEFQLLTGRRTGKNSTFVLSIFLEAGIFLETFGWLESQLKALLGLAFRFRYDHQVSRNNEGKIVTMIPVSRRPPTG